MAVEGRESEGEGEGGNDVTYEKNMWKGVLLHIELKKNRKFYLFIYLFTVELSGVIKEKGRFMG